MEHMAKKQNEDRFSNKADVNVLKQAEKLMQRAKSSLILMQVFYASLLFKLKTDPNWNAQTAWTDGRVIAYNPNYIVSLQPDEIRALLIHEVMHCAFSHHLRGKGLHHGQWNHATDYAINWIIDQLDGFSVMEGALLSTAFTDKSAEWIYKQLPPPDKSNNNYGQPDMGGMGEVRQWKNDNGQQPSGAELKEEEGAWKVAVNQAYSVAKAAGKIPAGMDRWVSRLLKPKINVKALLIAFLTECIKGDFSWKMPNQRYMASVGVYIPSLQPTINELQRGAYIADSSGSISLEDQRDILTIIWEIINTFNMELDVYSVDCKLQSHQVIDAYSDFSKINFKGGGGTDFKPAFKEMDKKGVDPVFCLYFTDGYCDSFPSKKPDFPVLWLLKDNQNESFDPPFGTVVRMES